MSDPLELNCPQCQKPYASQGGKSLVKVDSPRGQYVPCLVCWLRTERDAFKAQCRQQPEDQWEPALGPDSKVTLTLTGADLDTISEILAEHAIKVGSTPARKLSRWLRAVINKGPADAGGCLADWDGA